MKVKFVNNLLQIGCDLNLIKMHTVFVPTQLTANLMALV